MLQSPGEMQGRGRYLKIAGLARLNPPASAAHPVILKVR
jgi:hypothetical protein